MVCALVLAATIGGASMGSYSALNTTRLDSHASMVVAGNACGGCCANITPFSANLPKMEMVENGDDAIAYNDPISLHTYLLVMRNALLIPTMDHNLIPPFLSRKQVYCLRLITMLVDSETWMRIDLSLNGIFSYFHRCALT